MKKITSVTIHTTSEGERVSYTYSEITDDGVVVSENNRQSRIVLDTEANQNILGYIAGIKSYVAGKLEE